MSEPHFGQKLLLGGCMMGTCCNASLAGKTMPCETLSNSRVALRPKSMASTKVLSSFSKAPAFFRSLIFRPSVAKSVAAAAAPLSHVAACSAGATSSLFCAGASWSTGRSPSSAAAAIPRAMGSAPSSILAIMSNFSAMERSSRSRITSFSWCRSWPVAVMGPCIVRSWPQERQNLAVTSTPASQVGQ